jgi:hypothetical protein
VPSEARLGASRKRSEDGVAKGTQTQARLRPAGPAHGIDARRMRERKRVGASRSAVEDARRPRDADSGHGASGWGRRHGNDARRCAEERRRVGASRSASAEDGDAKVADSGPCVPLGAGRTAGRTRGIAERSEVGSQPKRCGGWRTQGRPIQPGASGWAGAPQATRGIAPSVSEVRSQPKRRGGWRRQGRRIPGPVRPAGPAHRRATRGIAERSE